MVYRFDAPLIFANSRIFGDEIRAIAENRRGLKWIVIAAEPVTDVDTTAADMLQELDVWLNERGISLIFAELKDPVREKIERYELTRTIDPDHFFPTIDAAVERYMHETDATWKVPKDGGSAMEPAGWPGHEAGTTLRSREQTRSIIAGVWVGLRLSLIADFR